MEYHPDHRAVARAAMEAIQYASLPLVHPEHLAEGLTPHFVTEKYYWAEKHLHSVTAVDITETLEKKIAALAAHTSQVQFLVEGIFQQAQAAGVNLQAALGPGFEDPLAALAWAIQNQAEADGRAAGYRYAELYRYERYHPLVESFLAQASSPSTSND
jgi:LmbE family N-acetylglucosaminyl deacetylase